MLALTPRSGLVALVLLHAAFLSPVLFGRVIFPHDNRAELGERSGPTFGDRKFSDVSSTLIPEITAHMRAAAHDGLALWIPDTALGRPAVQSGTLSPAYPLTRALMLSLSDPLRVFSALIAITALLMALFFYGFLLDRALHARAALVGACALSLGPFAVYWATFSMITSTLCWTAALLWALPRLVRRASAGWFLAVAFFTYCLLVSGYPQFTVMQCYLLAAIGLKEVALRPRLQAKLRAAALALCAGVCGVVASLPVLLDLHEAVQRSLRADPPLSFFLATLPRLDGLAAHARYLSSLVDAWVAFDPHANAPHWYDGWSLSLPIAGLLTASLVSPGARRVWPWLALATFCLAASLYAPLYVLMVKYLGFNLSRDLPLDAALIPALVAASHALDGLLTRRVSPYSLGLLVLPAFFVAAVALCTSSIRWQRFALQLLLLAVGAICARMRRPTVAWVLLAGVLLHSWPMLQLAAPEAILRDSQLTRTLRAELNGARYARVGTFDALPSNQEIGVGVRSIHSYDSLSARQYVVFAQRFTGADTTLGRHFQSLDPTRPLDRVGLAVAGVSTLLAPSSVELPGTVRVGRVGQIALARLALAPVGAVLTPIPVIVGGEATIPEETLLAGDKVVVEERNDGAEVAARFDPGGGDRLLFLSRQFHPRWLAAGLGTVRVNAFYQGVLVPAGISEVRLRFQPWARYVFLPHYAFAIALLTLIAWRRYGRQAGPASPQSFAAAGRSPSGYREPERTFRG